MSTFSANGTNWVTKIPVMHSVFNDNAERVLGR
jgi:hypothetical protein